MTFEQYCQYFERIINKSNEAQEAPYNNADYIDYTRLNWARMNRWLKTTSLNDELKAALRNISSPQHWIIITEPWCGDAAHCVPFLHLASQENELISVDYELRDAEPFRINDYLTNGGKSIPKLIIRDENNKDLATWGPRPAACQVVYDTLKAEKADFERVKTEIQMWYNHNKGVAIQEELLILFGRF